MEIATALASCLFSGVAAGYVADAQNRSIWKWRILGVILLGPILHTLLGVVTAFFVLS